LNAARSLDEHPDTAAAQTHAVKKVKRITQPQKAAALFVESKPSIKWILISLID
jgi:hypothetical protein